MTPRLFREWDAYGKDKPAWVGPNAGVTLPVRCAECRAVVPHIGAHLLDDGVYTCQPPP